MALTSSPAAPAQPGPEPDQSSPTGLRLLWQAAVRRPGTGQLVAAALLATLGFGLATQVRATAASGLSTLRQSELVGVLDDVAQRQARLQAETRQLEQTRQQLASGSSAAALAEARQRARTLGILAGTEPARGPGIVLSVAAAPGVLHYPTVLGAVQELRDAGAEAIQLGGARVTASTWFADTPEGVSVSGSPLSATFEMVAIGDPPTLAAALGIPGGVLDELAQNNARGVVTQSEDLQTDALRVLTAPQYARPAPVATAVVTPRASGSG